MRQIDSIEEFDALVAAHGSLGGVAVQGLDLCSRSDVLRRIEVTGAVLLGCVVEADVLRRLHAEGALVFPRFPDLPFRAFRNALYDADELFDGYVSGDPTSFAGCFDSRVYRWHQATAGANDVVGALAQRIHDHAIDDALMDLLQEDDRHHRVVAVMGGHGMRRDEPAYADVVRLAWTLAHRGYVVASGGGPGAMEATNLGGWLATHPAEAVDEALAVLADAPEFEPVPAWLDAAFEVRRRFPSHPDALGSLGVPTWHYGHEPPNVFATHIAKYFANSIREDGLLAIALAGVVFAPGSAGTIQEVFQDAAQNHYSTAGVISPMVFMGSHYWTRVKPVYPLLRQLSADHEYGRLVSIHDSVDDIVAAIAG